MNQGVKAYIYDTKRWGLDSGAIAELGTHLHSFWDRFKDNFKTKTKNVAGHALAYLKGLLLMDSKRNYANFRAPDIRKFVQVINLLIFSDIYYFFQLRIYELAIKVFLIFR